MVYYNGFLIKWFSDSLKLTFHLPVISLTGLLE